MSVSPFAFSTAPRIVFGEGTSDQLAAQASVVGSKPFIVTDPGIVSLGLIEKAVRSFGANEPFVFQEIGPDPSRDMVDAAVERACEFGATGVIGFGGGSSLDVAKLVALLLGADQPLDEAWGVGNARGPRLPLVLVPTTAGTGSEVTPVSIITVGETEKRGVSSPILLPDLAVLDPALTHGLPANITAATGIDAMVHAIEAYASKNSNNNPITRLLAREALELLAENIERAVAGEQGARAPMLLGSMLAGQAFANSPVAAVHALAYPLGGIFKVPHGLSNAVLLPHVLAFNVEEAAAERAYEELAPLVRAAGADGFIARLDELSANCGLEPNMSALGVREEDLDRMADDAMLQTRLLVNNPREVTRDDARAIYAAAL